ncbi:hypothetical protein W97_08689 [Coniosporium apollinis CBS 100218]|uniref:Protein phosphatase 4 core regulatory subunit R2 n=1 Tax=Coniosporium apollinis (strain CBS 100218) TaxID=1168221 RepID=R7Z5Y1_CONA1|nr:uncharacterized protein W97_08689 [Coniosporium apollinis CBS 100218]EON69429.1 hypothetical protein W97_08689 [Coniosporium apollinis CBS 100218]
MVSSQELLQSAAKFGSIETCVRAVYLRATRKLTKSRSDDWPRILEDVLARLENAIRDFPAVIVPAPDLPPARPPPILASPLKADEPSSQDSHVTDKENAPPATPSPRPPVPAFAQRTPQSSDISTPALPSAPDSDLVSALSALPVELRPLYVSIVDSLTKNFPKQAPHTVQRLAELILNPKQHYRFLPPYLRALDRVVCVSSSISVFPLPQAAVPSGGLLNGTTSPVSNSAAAALGSDESLGGALLTPIPWLRPDHERLGSAVAAAAGGAGGPSQSELKSESSHIVDGPNGAGRIETVTVVNGVITTATSTTTTSAVPTSSATTISNPAPSAAPAAGELEESLRAGGAVTQGELLRQEQEAGVVPVAQTSPRRSLLSSTGISTNSTSDSSTIADGAPEAGTDADEHPEEHPHARGPNEIGMEDMGPQERALGGELDMEAAVGRAVGRSEGHGSREEGRAGAAQSAEVQADTEMTDADADGEVEAEVGMVDAGVVGEADAK